MSISELIETAPWTETATGDRLYRQISSNDHLLPPDQVILSPDGLGLYWGDSSLRELAEIDPNVIPLDKTVYTGLSKSSIVTRESLSIDDLTASVKRLIPTPMNVTGIEQFTFMRLLQRMGYIVANPLLATRRLLISEWLAGDEITDWDELKDVLLNPLYSLVNQLISSGNCRDWWKLDYQSSNYLIVDPNTVDPTKRYGIIDPIWYDQTVRPSRSWTQEELSIHLSASRHIAELFGN